jgi:non-specific serine/threonine protein kinase
MRHGILLAGQSRATTEQSAPVLTARQREIALLIADGRTNQQIAASLGIAPRTADTHVSALLRRLGLTSRGQVAAWLANHDPAPDQAGDA